MASTAVDQQEKLRQQFVHALGKDSLDEGWQTILKFSPAFFEASIKLRSVPLKKGHLLAKIQHLIALVVDSAATHLYVPGIRADINAALQAGATVEEVVEVIELTCTLGIHACNIGVPLLVEVMKEEGIYEQHFPQPGEDEPEWDEYRARLKKEFTEKRGYWHKFWEDFLRVDPEFFEAYVEFSSVSWTKEVDGSKQGVLEPKVSRPLYPRRREMFY